MNPLIIYIIKSAVYLSGFYLVYRLFLSSDTMYGRNRAFIILSVISAMILPIITIQTNRPLIFPVFGKVLSEILVSGNVSDKMNSGSGSGILPVYRWIYIIYISGVVLFAAKLTIDLIELAFLINRQKKSGSNLIRFHGFLCRQHISSHTNSDLCISDSPLSGALCKRLFKDLSGELHCGH